MTGCVRNPCGCNPSQSNIREKIFAPRPSQLLHAAPCEGVRVSHLSLSQRCCCLLREILRRANKSLFAALFSPLQFLPHHSGDRRRRLPLAVTTRRRYLPCHVGRRLRQPRPIVLCESSKRRQIPVQSGCHYRGLGRTRSGSLCSCLCLLSVGTSTCTHTRMKEFSSRCCVLYN